MKFKITLVLSFLAIMIMCFCQADADRKSMNAVETKSQNTEGTPTESAPTDTATEERKEEPEPDIQTIVTEGGIYRPEDDEEKTDYEAPVVETISNNSIRVENEYGDQLLKSYDFEGKKIAFFGDSITYGAIAGGGTTKNTYPKLFCEEVDAEYDNLALGGSSFTGGGNEPKSIVQAVKDADLSSYDYLFIAGGANDCGNYHSVESMETALKELGTYLKENFSGKDVIFITPTPNWYFESEPNEDSRLYPYRQAIARIAEENGFSFINGDKMVIDDSDEKTVDIHPTEEGYELYADELYTRLVE